MFVPPTASGRREIVEERDLSVDTTPPVKENPVA